MVLRKRTACKPEPRRTLEYLNIVEIHPDPRNPRVHSKAQIAQIAASIAAFGFGAPLLVDKENVLISGHGRLLACAKLGLSEIAVVRLEDLTPEQARGMALAENRLVETSTWNDRLLSEHLQELSKLEINFNIEAIGFSMGEIDARIEKALGAVLTDEEPIAPESPIVTRLGDAWRLERHRIVCGDATDPARYVQLLEGRKVQAAFTDPPYNVKIQGHVSGKGKRRHREFAAAAGEMDEAEFISFLTDVGKLMAANSDAAAVHFECMDWRHLYEVLSAGRAVYNKLLNVCVWAKPNGGMGSLYRSAHELVTVWRVGAAPHRNNVELGRFGRNRTNVWEYSGFNGLVASEDSDLTRAHPTPKPVAMVAEAILDVTRRGDAVLDPFLGSAATLMAAERTGRTCYGMELDPAYVDLAIRRWRRQTGQTAFLISTGESFDALEGAGR